MAQGRKCLLNRTSALISSVITRRRSTHLAAKPIGSTTGERSQNNRRLATRGTFLPSPLPVQGKIAEGTFGPVGITRGFIDIDQR